MLFDPHGIIPVLLTCMLCNFDIYMYTNRKLGIKDMISFCLGIQSSDNGALIGGILGGTFFLAIIVFVCILVAKKRRQSYSGMLLPFLLSIPLLKL